MLISDRQEILKIAEPSQLLGHRGFTSGRARALAIRYSLDLIE